ncbi:uncharacterized [Tachysurus ichikawai]
MRARRKWASRVTSAARVIGRIPNRILFNNRGTYAQGEAVIPLPAPKCTRIGIRTAFGIVPKRKLELHESCTDTQKREGWRKCQLLT